MARDCFVRVDLISVFYSGKNIGNDWEFTITFTPPGGAVGIPRHQLNHNTTKNYNITVMDQPVGPCDPGPQFQLLITAREHDWLVDDVVNHRVLTPVYDCLEKPVTHGFFTQFLVTESPVVIPRIGNLEFKFEITLHCIEV